ncbi:MAG: methylmalonyl-CoA mutase family protein [Propionibacteriaceae bacterium]|jgi:methylmalonyl-CoA mutase|nr:methylmalonyl-CoA mutase family protein [Propionibacteriaceae bacterium]
MADETMVLAGDFPQPTQSDWDREVLKIMNRRRPPGTELTLEQAMKRLTSVYPDGLVVDPLYTMPDNEVIGYPGQIPFTRGAEPPQPRQDLGWDIVQLHEDPDAGRTHQAVLEDLNAGGTGVWLRVDGDAVAPADLAAVLAGVVPGAASVAVSSVDHQAEAAHALLAFWAGASQPGAATGNLGIDPLAAAAVTGQPADLSGLADWVGRLQGFPKARALAVDVCPYDNAGAGDIDQVAYAVATGIEYVRALASQGVDAAAAFGQIMFRVAATADQFPTIARLRALRRLWARVGEVLGVPEADRGARQQAVSSWRVISRDDPWVNLLRGTVGVFAAAVGGADAITALPHDTAYGLPTKFSRRLARNLQLLAAEEAHLGAAADPAGGAWFVEALTDQIAVKAWARVQAIEAAGGMSAALAAGTVAAEIAAVVAERDRRLATRRVPLTGVSMFPKQDEAPLADFLARPAAPARAGLPQHRDAEVFEALRDRTARAAAAGARPAVLMACLGPQREFGVRQQFTSNLLMVAGLDWPTVEDAPADAVAAKARELGSRVVILASSAKVYADQAVPAAQALKDAGVAHVCIAGRLKEAGDGAGDLIDTEIYDGMDVVAFLTETLDRLGVAK